jgi:4-amino-4-deoxy-L-arabinose transferase-like glycosyltransferase
VISSKYSVIALLFLAFTIRIAAIAVSDHTLTSDEVDYLQLAESIRLTQSYALDSIPTAYRPPGYPVFIAGIMAVIPSVTLVLCIQALLETITCFLLYRLGSTVLNQSAGLTAMSIWAFLPGSILMPGLLLSESLFTTLLIGILTLWTSAPRWNLFGGILLGIGILIKPQFVLLAALWIMWRLFNKQWRDALTVALLAGIILAPWIIRNGMVFGEPAITTSGGVNFWIGNNPEANGSYHIPSVNPLNAIHNEIERSNEGYKLGMAFIAAEPMKTIMLAGKKIAYLWSSQHYLVMLSQDGIDPEIRIREQVRRLSPVSLIVMNLPFLLMIVLGIAGFFFLPAGQASFRRLIIALILVWTAVHIGYFGAARFSYPLYPLFALTASMVIHRQRSFASLPRRSHRMMALLSGMFILIMTADLLSIFF